MEPEEKEKPRPNFVAMPTYSLSDYSPDLSDVLFDEDVSNGIKVTQEPL